MTKVRRFPTDEPLLCVLSLCTASCSTSRGDRRAWIACPCSRVMLGCGMPPLSIPCRAGMDRGFRPSPWSRRARFHRGDLPLVSRDLTGRRSPLIRRARAEVGAKKRANPFDDLSTACATRPRWRRQCRGVTPATGCMSHYSPIEAGDSSWGIADGHAVSQSARYRPAGRPVATPARRWRRSSNRRASARRCRRSAPRSNPSGRRHAAARPPPRPTRASRGTASRSPRRRGCSGRRGTAEPMYAAIS